MLNRLSIRNFILIDNCDIEFDKGLCVITGETGAGKSVFIDALIFCLGGKFGENISKYEAEPVIVSAEFTLNTVIRDFLENNALPIEETLIIKRYQSPSKVKKIFINDSVVTLKLLNDLGDLLIEYLSQNMHNFLEKPSSHLDALDSYAGNNEIKEEIQSVFKQIKALETDLKAIQDMQMHITSEKEYLEYSINELESSKIQVGEENTLLDAKNNLQKIYKESELIEEAVNALEDNNFESRVIKAQKNLLKISNNHEANNINNLLEQVLINFQAAKDELKNLQFFNKDKELGNLEKLEERLFFIKGLLRKYQVNDSINLLGVLDSYKEKLGNINFKIGNADNLSKELVKARKSYQELAITLRNNREIAAVSLEQKINQELKFLKMENARFKVEISYLDLSSHTSTGLDKVVFLASTNPGSNFAPINKIASGGELARLMLAYKLVMHNDGKCIIFDEIDTGLSGAVASFIGERLKKLSNTTQVITITHQPQVASYADMHISVRKETRIEGNVSTTVKPLVFEEKIEEIAGMLSGKNTNQAAREAAKELLKS